jgi:DNA-binding GntR family transcriptional regulator
MAQLPKPTRSVPLREQVMESLIQALRSGVFRPGEWLTEQSVGEVLGVSRTPVREALGMLAQRGLLTRREGGGYAVASTRGKALAGIFELRRLIEPFAARRAAELASTDQVKQLAGAIQVLRKAVARGEPGAVMKANQEVRRLLFSFADNEALTNAISQLNDHVQYIGTLTMADRTVQKIVLSHHLRVFAAIQSGNAAAAERAIRAYLDAAYESLSAALAAETAPAEEQGQASEPNGRLKRNAWQRRA